MVRSVAELATLPSEDFTQHAESVVTDSRSAVSRFVDSDAAGEDLLEEFDELTARLEDLRRLALALSHCHPDAAMRSAAQAAEQNADKVATEISLDARVYDRLRYIDLTSSDLATRHLVDRLLRTFRRAGVDRDEATRTRLRQIREELVSVGQKFQHTINSDIRIIRLSPDALDGLPEDYVRTHPAHDDGQVRISTEYTESIPFLTYSRDARAREQLWREMARRGYPQNVALLRRMLELRHEFARLLGYESWAQYVTEDKMIGSDGAANEFISRISTAAHGRMRRDKDALLQRKRRDDPSANDVLPWDSDYLTDRIKAEQLTFNSQSIRPYLEYRRVRDGLIAITERLFGVRFRESPDIPVWHPDVNVFDVVDEAADGALLGRVFLDMHPREGKLGIGAMCALAGGKAGRRIPECVLLSGFPRPGDKPALLQPEQVTMFCHELGHVVHHILGGHQRWAGNAGIKTESDFSEAPAQLLEEWTQDPSTLRTFARHHETGEPVPDSLVRQLRVADEFGKGLMVRRQMFFAALSLELHRRDPNGLDLLQVEHELWARHDHCAPVDGAWLHLSFGHLESYSAFYYAYMWSQAIARDMLTTFDRHDVLARPAAQRLRRTVFEPGGSAPAADLLRDFLGRDHNFAAFEQWLNSTSA